MRLPILILIAWIALGPASASAELSPLERETLRQDAELAGQAKFCGMAWRPLYRAVLGTWRESGRSETDLREIDRIFQQIMKSQAEILGPDFCTMGQIQIDYSMERALRFYGADPAAFGN
ncbi:MAG: hypothetical protein HOH66_05765 [Rhodospirillaceae bacterium]|jgi:hypothetical protein|nr:hypothetical protein [Rhodospirillaceae bacterium]MBT6117355.1 hypothetical protein [Rhodospirillaceae bacterium]